MAVIDAVAASSARVHEKALIAGRNSVLMPVPTSGHDRHAEQHPVSLSGSAHRSVRTTSLALTSGARSSPLSRQRRAAPQFVKEVLQSTTMQTDLAGFVVESMPLEKWHSTRPKH
jgi:hypothetical protein